MNIKYMEHSFKLINDERNQIFQNCIMKKFDCLIQIMNIITSIHSKLSDKKNLMERCNFNKIAMNEQMYNKDLNILGKLIREIRSYKHLHVNYWHPILIDKWNIIINKLSLGFQQMRSVAIMEPFDIQERIQYYQEFLEKCKHQEYNSGYNSLTKRA